MPRKKPAEELPKPVYIGLTPNQVIAYNLHQAREWKGWTQEQAADALEPYLGVRWSKANYSAAERSITGNRIRQFTADEIVAFARAFDLPVTWFFLPPPPTAMSDKGIPAPAKLATPDAELLGTGLALLVDLVFGTDSNQALLEHRLQRWLEQLGAHAPTDAQQQIANLARTRIEAVIRHSFGDIGQWQTWLRNIANRLEDLESLARNVISEDLDERRHGPPTNPLPAKLPEDLYGPYDPNDPYWTPDQEETDGDHDERGER